MKALWRGRVIAESERALEVDGYAYFPRESVRMELLSASPRTPDDRACPHGVRFFDIAADGERSERSAWSYEAPQASLRRVERWIGFWEDVRTE